VAAGWWYEFGNFEARYRESFIEWAGGNGVGCTGFASIIADFARNGVCIAEKNADERTKECLSG
jgi:hypothetical protein